MGGASPGLALSPLRVISGILSTVVVPGGVAVASADTVVLVILSVLSVSEIAESVLSGGDVGSMGRVTGSEMDTAESTPVPAEVKLVSLVSVVYLWPAVVRRVEVSKESPVSSATLLGGASGETLVPVVLGGALLKVVESVDCATVLL